MAAATAILGTLLAGSLVHQVESSREQGRQMGQAQDRTNKAMAAEDARQTEVKKKTEIGKDMMSRRARQRALSAGRGGRADTILTSGLGGGDGGGSTAANLGSSGGKTLLGS